jgi:hypothetical protein
MRRSRIVGVVLIFLLCSGTAATAWWLATSDPGSSSAKAGTLPAGNKPVTSVSPPSSLDVSLSWAPSTGGAPVQGYDVHAYAAVGGAPRTIGGTCTGLVTGTTCTDTSVPNGVWRYTVVPRQQAWYGAASPLSNSATVDPGYRSYVMADGPAAYWRLGESSGTTAVDEVGGGDGSYVNSPTLGQSGAMAGDANTATSLNGSTGRVTVPAAATGPSVTGNLSVEAWIRPNPTQPAFSRVVARYNGTTVQYMLAYEGNGKYLRFLLDVASGRPQAQSTAELRDGLWHHVVGTWDGTTARLYVDGVVQTNTGPGSGAVQLSNTTTVIGADSIPSSYYSGVVDEVAVYDSDLSPAQILTHHQQGSLNRPTVALAFPAANGRYNTTSWNAGCSSQICGTAADPDGSVASVSVSVRRGFNGLYWNGTSFASATKVLLPATGTTSWTRAFAGSAFPLDDAYFVTTVVTDDAGNDGGFTRSFNIDRAAPTVAVTFPAASGTYNAASWPSGCSSRICGTASDPSGSLASVALSIRQGTGNYWNGTAFASATEVLLAASGTGSWAYTFFAANFPADGAYTVRAVATDVAGNTFGVSRGFAIDRVAPSVAVSFPTTGGLYTSGTWDAGCTAQLCGTTTDAGTVAAVTVSIRQGTGNYWNGTAFASGTEVLLPASGTTSWVHAFAAANLPADGAYTVRAVATDAGGNTGTASSTATLDTTAPAPTAISLVDADGLITPTTDEVAITFSESLSASSLCSTWSGTGDQTIGGSGTVVTITENGADDLLTVTTSGCTLNVGSLATGGDYVSATSTFDGSTTGTESRVTWTAATRVLTIHLGSHTSGSLNAVTQSTGTITYTPHASITDRVGNPVATTPLAITNRRF